MNKWRILIKVITLGIVATQATTNNPQNREVSRYIHIVHPLVAQGTVTTKEDPIAVQALVAPRPSGSVQDSSIPMTGAHVSRALMHTLENICFEILQISEKHRMATREQVYQPVDTQYMRCTGRCSAILGGYYTDENGVNVEAMYQKLTESKVVERQVIREEFLDQKERCLASIPKRPKDVPVDVCDRIYEIYLCFRDFYELVMVIPMITLGIAVSQAATNDPPKRNISIYTHPEHPLVAEGTITSPEDPLVVQALVPPRPSGGALQDTSVSVVAHGFGGLFRTAQELCFEILQIPEDHRKIARQLILVDTQYARCTRRCVAVLIGFYTEKDGSNNEAAYRKMQELIGGSVSKEQYIADREECLSSIPEKPSDVDVCDDMYHRFQCYYNDYKLVMNYPLHD